MSAKVQEQGRYPEKHGSITIDRAVKRTNPRGEHDPWAGVLGARKEPDMAERPGIKMRALKVHMANDGRRLPVSAEYTLYSEREALEHVQKRLGERLSPEHVEVAEGAAESAAVDETWKLQIGPEAYLEKWPDGPNAAQARAALA